MKPSPYHLENVIFGQSTTGVANLFPKAIFAFF
jgi:hypothetical protein